MRFTVILIFFVFAVKQQFAQDTIVKRDQQIVIAKILEVSETEVKYKRFDLPEGPLYIENKAGIAYIAYSNGDKDKFTPAQNPEPVSILTSPQYLYKSPELRISANYISSLNSTNWEQKGVPMNEQQLHLVLLKSGDPTLKRMVRSAAFAQKNQYVGLAAIPAGVTGIVLGAIATTRIFGINNNYANYDAGDYILGSMLCAAVAVSTNIFGVSAFHAHRRKNAQAVELYNQLY